MRKLPFLLLAALPLLAGCSGGSGAASPSDEAALKAKLDQPMGSPSGGPKPANPKAPKSP